MKKWTKTTHIAMRGGVAVAVLAGLSWFAWPAVLAARERLPSASGALLIQLVGASAWPMFSLAALLVLRKQLRAFASAIASRASKVSVMNLEIELAQSARLTEWPALAIQGIKEADGAVIAHDSAASLFRELHGTPSDFAVVNLGHGREWLTSRIYILATLLRRMRSIRAIVFLCDSRAHEHLFLGVVLPENLSARFDYYYPWLGECLQSQYKSFPPRPTGPPPEELNVHEAQSILGFYIEDLRKKPDNTTEEDWTELREGVWEHATWVDESTLKRTLGAHLERSSLQWKPTLGKDDTRAILGKQGPFVALVDGEGVFRDILIDRAFMIETAAREIAARGEGG